MKHIDIESWSRREAFNFFKDYEYPQFNVCAQIPITETYEYLEKNNIAKFNAVLWLISSAANRVPQIRCRIRDNRVVEHSSTHPSFAVMTDNQSLAFCAVEYTTDLHRFFRETEKGIERIKLSPNMEDEPGRDDLIFVSCIPWINFTSISHPLKQGTTDSIPRISWGKFMRENNRVTMPVSLQLHHGLADGYHAGLFFEKLEALLAQPELIDWPTQK